MFIQNLRSDHLPGSGQWIVDGGTWFGRFLEGFRTGHGAAAAAFGARVRGGAWLILWEELQEEVTMATYGAVEQATQTEVGLER